MSINPITIGLYIRPTNHIFSYTVFVKQDCNWSVRCKCFAIVKSCRQNDELGNLVEINK